MDSILTRPLLRLINLVSLKTTPGALQKPKGSPSNHLGIPNSITKSVNMATNGPSPKITLYTNHLCPFAQRAHITLDELQLPHEEVLIDLETPRPQWYLDINPRGLVPSIKYSVPGVLDKEEIITESAVVAQFLCDSFPSHLLPAVGKDASPSAALTRARINFFCDTWSDKISSTQWAIMQAETPEEKETKAKETIAAIKKEIEPLLANADPFFGGSKELTFAEVFTAPFIQRMVALAEDGELYPRGLLAQIEELPNFSRWVKAVLGQGSVTRIFNKEKFLDGTKRRMQRMKDAKK